MEITLGFLLLLKRKWLDSSSFAPLAYIQATFFAKSRATSNQWLSSTLKKEETLIYLEYDRVERKKTGRGDDKSIVHIQKKTSRKQ